MKKIIAGLLLASGQGRRFDPDGQVNKLLVRLPDGRTVIRAAADHLSAVLEQVHVVIPNQSIQAFRAALDPSAHLISNLRASEGMGTSIATGVLQSVRQSPAIAGWIIALGDMPFVQTQTIARLRDALLEGADIVAPGFAGRRGNPVGFSVRHAAALGALSGDQGARELLKRHPVRLIETGDSGILKDIDTADDLDAHA